MALRIFIVVIVCVVGAISVWVDGLQITTTAIPSEFAFVGNELLQDKEELPSGSSTVETTETYSRPLFSGTRRPFQVVEENEPDVELAPPVIVEQDTLVVETERPRLKLLGTEPAAKAPSALITVEESGTSSWFQAGDLVAGWRILKIGTEEIELSNANDQNVNFSLSLYPDKR